jgi:hypothetical protein
MTATRSAGRIVALVFGIILVLPALGLIVGGGVLLWADWNERSDGFVVSPEEEFLSPGHALVTDTIDIQTAGDWLPLSAALGTARVEVSAEGGQDVFVGIAPAADVTAYLGDVQRTVIDDLGFDAPATRSDQIPGGEPSGPPTEQDFWTVQTSGGGVQELTWDPAEGDWMLVIMNADGSPGVLVQARIGAEFPALGGIAWGVLIVGVVLTVVAVVLLVIGIRRPADRQLPPPAPGGAVPPPRGPAAQEVWYPQSAAQPPVDPARAPGGAPPGPDAGGRTP